MLGKTAQVAPCSDFTWNEYLILKEGLEMAQKTTNLLAGLPNETVITSCTCHTHADELHITFPDPNPVCPDCGSHSCIKKGHVPFRIRHTAGRGRAVILSFQCFRYRCKDCGRTFTMRPGWIHPSLHITQSLFLTVSLDLAQLLSVSAIARTNCVPGSTVQAILDHTAMPHPSRFPATLCIDEFKGDSGSWNPADKKWNHIKFQCSIADGDSGVIIDILPDTTADYLTKFFLAYPVEVRRRVKYFCCDMHNAYPSLAKRCFPDAVICIDLFHVINRLNTAVDEVRRRLQNSFKEQDDETRYECLKHSSYLLKTAASRHEKLWNSSYDRKKARLEAALSVSADMEAAYDMLQEFHLIAETSGYALQRSMLTDWINKFASSEIPEIRSAVRTVQHWRGYIQNSFKLGKSNGPCEGLNNKIKVLKRISFGVHDFESFRKRILLSCGYTHWDTDTSKYAMTRIERESSPE